MTSVSIKPQQINIAYAPPTQFNGTVSATPTLSFAPAPLKEIVEKVLLKKGSVEFVQKGSEIFIRSSGWTLAKATITAAIRSVVASLATNFTKAALAGLLKSCALPAAVISSVLALTAQSAGESEPDFQAIKRSLTLAGFDINKHPELVGQLLNKSKQITVLLKNTDAGKINKQQLTQAISALLNQTKTGKLVTPNAPVKLPPETKPTPNRDFGDHGQQQKLNPVPKVPSLPSVAPQKPVPKVAQLPKIASGAPDFGKQIGELFKALPAHVFISDDISQVAEESGIPKIELLKEQNAGGGSFRDAANRILAAKYAAGTGSSQSIVTMQHLSDADKIAIQKVADAIAAAPYEDVEKWLNTLTSDQKGNLPKPIKDAVVKHVKASMAAERQGQITQQSKTIDYKKLVDNVRIIIPEGEALSPQIRKETNEVMFPFIRKQLHLILQDAKYSENLKEMLRKGIYFRMETGSGGAAAAGTEIRNGKHTNHFITFSPGLIYEGIKSKEGALVLRGGIIHEATHVKQSYDTPSDKFSIRTIEFTPSSSLTREQAEKKFIDEFTPIELSQEVEAHREQYAYVTKYNPSKYKNDPIFKAFGTKLSSGVIDQKTHDKVIAALNKTQNYEAHIRAKAKKLFNDLYPSSLYP